MHTFGMKGRTLALTTLHPAGRDHESEDYYIGCGSYVRLNGRWEWTGEGLRGNVPIKELVRWALRKGFLQFDMSDPDRHDRIMQAADDPENHGLLFTCT